jgi:hypothetical protein
MHEYVSCLTDGRVKLLLMQVTLWKARDERPKRRGEDEQRKWK